ncbi:MAG TPA: phosphoribosylanthranilate isomerase [Blastocatellia bacterium]|nr:phosphoribosylanthranilate isomerase [Blastocatellia bacterium]
MKRVRVKICGVRTLEEAEASVEAGADALGFNFWPDSPRFITPEEARRIVAALPALITCIGVFVNEDAGRVREIVSHVALNTVQLHGEETARYCLELGSVKVIKAFRVGNEFNPKTIRAYPVSAILLDAKVEGQYGGTGKRFSWEHAIQAKRFAPVILAGGLNVDNVAEAITYVRPFAIDVCSGVESAPGRKDLNRLREFMEEVARANIQQ